MIQSAFKQEIYNYRMKCFECCQVIVRFENDRYHANIFRWKGRPGYEGYNQVDTPDFATRGELGDHIRNLLLGG